MGSQAVGISNIGRVACDDKPLEQMSRIARSHEASVAQVALAWLLSKPMVASVIIGASKLHQLEDNLKAIAVKLDEMEIAELDAMTAPTSLYPNWFNANLIDAQHKAALSVAR